jgi:hypothetical protein
MSELNNKILALIESKDFEELSQAEKDFVLRETTMHVYNTQRKSLLSAQTAMQEERLRLQPDPSILARLQKRLDDDEVVAVPLWQRITHHKVPAYWVAVAAMLAIAFVAFWPRPEPEQMVKYVDREVPVYATVYDTVYLENDRPINRVVVEKVVRPNSPTSAVSEVINTLEVVDPGVVIVPQVPDIKDIEQSYGNQPISKDELNQFRVSL